MPLHDASSAPADLAPILERVERSVRSVPAMYRALGNAPRLLDAWVDFAWKLRSDAEVARGLRELGIMRVAQLSNSDYVWRSHWRPALAGGISEEQLLGLATWSTGDLFDREQRAILAVADSLTRDADLDDAIWNELRQSFDDREAVELLLTFSWYACVARMANGLRVPVEEANQQYPRCPVGSPLHGGGTD